jgi:agmatinase
MAEAPFREADMSVQQASYSGLITFMRRPAVAAEALADTGADVVISGIPFDIATTNRSGARFGPRSIREQSLQLAWGPIWPWGFDPFERLKVVDAGDVAFDWGRPQEMPHKLTEHTARVLEVGATPITFGGDHFCTLPVLRAIHAKHGPVALVQFDAHRDVEEGAGQGRMDHGTVIAEALLEGLIDESASVQVGIRTTYPGETGQGMTIIDAAACHAMSAEQIAAVIRDRVGARPIYLTFDIDCLDHAFAPGTGTPVPGGLSTHQVRAILWALKGLSFTGFDLMEVCPPCDAGEITALAAATLAVDFCCLLAAS